MRILTLIGQMGAGKSTIAKVLAWRWAARGWDVVDLDEVIATRAGASVSALFAERGEAAFRRLEAEALVAALGGERLIVATGGGAPCQPNAMRRILAAGPCVWLDAAPSVLAARAVAAGGRPLLDGLMPDAAAAYMAAQRAERAPFYEQASHTVDASAAPAEVADAIERLVSPEQPWP